MADPKQLEILKSGVENWNRFRNENPHLIIDLSKADLITTDLSDAYLSRLNLTGANFSRLNLTGANFSRAELFDVDFSEADLSGVNFSETELYDVNFSRANLFIANLVGAIFSRANLIGANFNGAILFSTIFLHSSLSEASFLSAKLRNTIFTETDLSKTEQLESCQFFGECYIDYHTLKKSCNLPVNFLRGCGLSDTFIDHIPALFNKAIQFYSCFISYSSKDEEIAKKIHADLQDKGIRCWFAPEDLKIGDKFRSTIHEAIKVYDKLLLIISENSINSHWVEDEVERAFEKERKQNRTVLFPVTVDQNIFNIDAGWANSINKRHIGDFIYWKNHDSYKKAFDRLVRDLKQEGPK
jgi:uncharacterized protein YjbI with pentapeptide repeats